jgi:DNA-binding IclR family transcriptional regulator
MRVCLHRIESNSALRLHLKEGERHTLLPGGTGLVLLAFSGENGDAYDRIRDDYFVINIGGREAEISSVAAPVLRAGGELVGTISLTGSTGNYSGGKANAFVPPLLSAAAELTRLCGGDTEPFHKRLKNL